jgi:hypothetical protein
VFEQNVLLFHQNGPVITLPDIFSLTIAKEKLEEAEINSTGGFKYLFSVRHSRKTKSVTYEKRTLIARR